MLLTATLIFTFTFVMLLVFGLTMPKETNSLRFRMARIARTEDAERTLALAEEELSAPFADRIIKPFLRRLSRLGDRYLPGKSAEETQLLLGRAGHPYGMGVIEFNGFRVLCISVGIVVGVLAFISMNNTFMMRTIMVMACMIFGLLLPDTILQRGIAKRQTGIRRSLPETIDLLVVSVEAGMGFDGAVDKVVTKMKGPLVDEFERSLQEMRMGKSRMQSLKDMAERIGLTEMTAFVAAVYQADQLGVSIARVLHVQSTTIRTARVQRIREIAATLPVKMLFPLVFFIFPAIFVVMLGPGIIRIMNAF